MLVDDAEFTTRSLGNFLWVTFTRSNPAADIAGIRAFVVHAKDDLAWAFYVHFGFAQGFSDPMHLYILTKDLKALVIRS